MTHPPCSLLQHSIHDSFSSKILFAVLCSSHVFFVIWATWAHGGGAGQAWRVFSNPASAKNKAATEDVKGSDSGYVVQDPVGDSVRAHYIEEGVAGDQTWA